MIVNKIYELIGNTPIINITDLFDDENMASIYLKLEWFNPGGSIKDRIAINMIEHAEKDGLLKAGDTIIEPTSGNTGIGIALVAASKGYNAILTMPQSVSEERRKILKGYGAELILTPSHLGMNGSIEVAKELQEKHGYFMLMQFQNIYNPESHMKHTVKEIMNDLPNITHFIAGVGTGGTITGVGKILKEYKPHVQIIAIEPTNSAVISGNPPGPHKIQGIGAGFIPKILDTSIIDKVVQIEDEQAYEMARFLAKKGLFVGISTGANVYGALQLAKTLTPSDIIVTVSPSNGERYLSTDLYV